MRRLRAGFGSSPMFPGAVFLMVLMLYMLPMAACKPWTVRPIEEPATAAAGPAMAGDPSAYVSAIWEAKVLPAAIDGAVELASVLDSTQPPTNLFVKATAVVVAVDTTSRVGLARLDLIPTDGQIDAALQIGPVLRGTALRDALDFVKFGDFVNQIEFAGVATALNERARQSVLQHLAPDALKGRTVVFTGAVKTGALLEIVPVVLRVEERAR